MSPVNRLLLTERLTAKLADRGITVYISERRFRNFIYDLGGMPHNDGKPHGLSCKSKSCIIVTHEPDDSPYAYACLLHEMGHAFDTTPREPRDTIRRELTAWEFVLENTPTWDIEQHDYLARAIMSYVRRETFVNQPEYDRLIALLTTSLHLTEKE